MSNINKEKRKVFLIFAAMGCFFSFFQPTCGAFTRVTGSGDGCPDWPTCFGSWIPPLNDINAIIEWSHRTSGTLFGLVSISVLIFSFLIYKKFKTRKLSDFRFFNGYFRFLMVFDMLDHYKNISSFCLFFLVHIIMLRVLCCFC